MSFPNKIFLFFDPKICNFVSFSLQSIISFVKNKKQKTWSFLDFYPIVKFDYFILFYFILENFTKDLLSKNSKP
jgi:hypothetical protein